MQFLDLEHIVERAAARTMSKKKLTYTGLTLFFCGLVMLFGMSASVAFGSWLSLSLNFVPLFVSLALIMALGVILVQSYSIEQKQHTVEMKDLALRSWPTILGTLSLFVPVVIAYLALWMAQGIFLVCTAIPFIGPFFAVVFAFIPFILHLATLVLGLMSIYFLFCLTPTLAHLGGLPGVLGQAARQEEGSQGQELSFVRAFKESLTHGFTRMALFLLGLVPLIVCIILLGVSWKMTTMMFDPTSAEELVMQRFFLMLPFALLLAPAVIFFFNIAAETQAFVKGRG